MKEPLKIAFNPNQPKGFIAQILKTLVALLVLGGTLMFSLIAFAILAVVAALGGLIFWWKTRAIRAQIREQIDAANAFNNTSANEHSNEPESRSGFAQASPQKNTPSGETIEGQAVRVTED